MIIHYDNRFNANEWFVIGMLTLVIILLAVLPRRFPVKWAAVFTLYGAFSGLYLDHTLAVEPLDYYDVNDNSSFELLDFLTYVIYGPFSYLLAYLHDRWKIKPSRDPLYVLCWALLSVGVEWFAMKIGVFHYKNGYNLYYSFPIYLLVISLSLLFFHKMNGMRTERGV
ncbi:hypothetical protein RB620_03535 [Paenibacillus sp. LHD-117]|uniref:hypothetical protein n=1 Tax=Paenibacillus sp. LHD-117 TaxID=3071412 RepID=UPI0027E0C514|nr:hypothetical protein [Paenibacillus sp. LHD-117]MDQ6418502.1 hypothetical protein [Paenibacillus sp. LHD-117]